MSLTTSNYNTTLAHLVSMALNFGDDLWVSDASSVGPGTGTWTLGIFKT